MFDLIHDNWMTIGLSGALFGILLLMACGCGVFTISVWKPETAYDCLLRVRRMFTRS